MSDSDVQCACLSGEAVARLYKYYRQFYNAYQSNPVPLARVSATRLYKNHQRSFDTIYNVFTARHSDVNSYVKFFADELGKCERDIDSCLCSPDTIKKYQTYVSARTKRKNIFEWFRKSAVNLAELCVKNGYAAKDGLKYLMQNRLLAAWYVGGKMSKYYLAAIPKFNEIVDRLDHFSKLDLRDVKEKYEIYNTEINEAMLYYKNTRVNPISYTDNIIDRLKNSKLVK